MDLLAAPAAEIELRFLRIVGAPARLTHEEHDPIDLPPGTYRVVRQREYRPEVHGRPGPGFLFVLD